MQTNKKRFEGVTILLILALILSDFFSSPMQTHAITVEKTVTKYHLDIGAQHIWGTGSSVETAAWEKEANKGEPITVRISLEFPQEVSNVRAYELTSSNFNWEQAGYSFNPTAYLHNKNDYDYNYKKNVSNAIYNITAIASGNTINLSYTAILDSSEDFDLKTNLNMGRLTYILDMLGGENSVREHYPDVYERLVEGAEHGIADDVYGFMYFTPVVIAYDVVETVEIGEFEPELDLPETAKQREEYTAADATIVDDVTEIDYAVLEKHYGNGNWEEVTFWDGPGVPGESTGGEAIESCCDACTVTYRLRVTDKTGQQKSVTKPIRITDSREISVTPILSLPAYTYEGHPALAEDKSAFVVNGSDYSAARAYAENIADNSFFPSGSYGSVSRLTDTKADVTFTKAGNYTVKLAVDPVSGKTVYDTKPIEVRKTPEILDSLSGFQKQNRKQILDIAVATYPGKPLTDYSITLKDKKTGESVTLTPGNPQANNANATIKTRAVAMTQDTEKGFAYITVEFLTKTPSFAATGASPQDFSYEIHVTDSKGDTDTASRTFAVAPDRPPTATISLDSVFLRNEGTNTASIAVEDVTVAIDGDGVARTWYYGSGTAPSTFTNVASMDGYKKLSFGTDKIVGFNKAGVGKFTVKLDVKEVWTEPTLEEYVTDADHLTGSATAVSDVQNVAPIVSLELLNSTEQEILLLANNDSEYQTLLNNKTALQQALLANKIDGQIIIKKLVGSTPPTVTGVQQQRALSFPYPAKARSDGLATEVNESRLLAVDSEKTYFLTYTWTDGNAAAPMTVHALNSFSSGEAWSYTTSRNENFTYGQDDTGTYLYLIYKDSNQSVLLDKRTGAAAGTINIALSDKVWLSDNLAFMIENGSLYAVNLNSLTKILVSGSAAAVSRVGGNLQFIEKTANAIVRCTLDMETLEISRDILINIVPGTSAPGDYTPICIDSAGKAVLWKNAGAGTDAFRGFRTYDANNKFIKETAVSNTYGGTVRLYFSLDEKGQCSHALYWECYKNTNPDSNAFAGVDLNAGTSKTLTRKTDDFTLSEAFGGYAGAFESNGTSHFMFNGYYSSGSLFITQFTATFNGSSISAAAAGPGTAGSYSEDIRASDRTLAAMLGDNDPASGSFTLKIMAFPRTLVQETAEIISRFTSKLTFKGDVNTTAGQIKTVAEVPKPAVKITANTDGYLSLSNLPLSPNRKYYYEYEIKPLTDGTKSKLTGITANTPTSTSPQSFLSDTLYVTDTYEEDFNDGTINPFFTVNDPGVIMQNPSAVSGYGAGTTVVNGEGVSDNYMKLSFTVPAGKQATVTLDYSLSFGNSPASIYDTVSKYSGTNVFVDGAAIRDKDAFGNNADYASDSEGSGYTRFKEAAAGAVFYKLLGPGTHTIECKVSSSGFEHVLMDNLRVDILSAAPKASGAASSMRDGDSGGWLDASGSFDVPAKVISYGAQASTTYYGGLPSAVTAYSKGYPKTIEYYQTVPAGYIQKGKVHLGSEAYRDYVNHTYCINGFPGLLFDYRYYSMVNTWRTMTPKTEGTYTHTVDMGQPKNGQAWIDAVDLVQYPNNAVTVTGNMAFNADNTKYFFPKVTSTQVTNLSMFIPKGEYLIKNLRLYYIENGQKICVQDKAFDNVADLPNWTLSSGLAAANYSEAPPENEEGPIKIYKKGEKVLYNIFYDDYENDPSKAQYWVYQHVSWPPDGVHPDAGKTLNAPIDRFYLSGKYTVTHWQLDNTQRAGTEGDATPYNKLSNQVSLTFYVDGGGAAPWITYIRTNPATIKENNTYTIAVGVDDAEKDTLTLETEVYRDGKSIFTHRRENLQANAAGVYPETLISGLPAAQVGVYQVICTVRDWSGVGLGSYKFTVVSEGKITGFVNHTDQWDDNRKKYNLERFGEEVNRSMLLGDYKAMPAPRKRGTNVFWSGEKFLLRAETEGEPQRVDVRIQTVGAQGNRISTGYAAELADTGKQAPSGADLWEGSLWDSEMINKWGRKEPEPLYFIFTAYYAGGTVKTSEAAAIVDSRTDYWRLHRLW
jgi:hypothetical protein